jgi:hypothetical protein
LWQPRRRSSLAEYAGTYKHSGYGTAEVLTREGSLVLKWSNFNPKLTHYHFDIFDVKERGPMADTTVQFVLGANGEVAGRRMLDQEFQKQPAARNATAASEN